MGVGQSPLGQWIEGAGSIAIGGHVRPDGDCAGACLGLARYISQAYPQKQLRLYLEALPPVFSYLWGFDMAGQMDGAFAPDVFFVLDCAPDRMPEAAKAVFGRAGLTVNIDHHISNKGGCMVNLIDANKSSTAEMVYDLASPLYMDREMADCLYTGMIHDTGVFQYSCTGQDTLRAAAELIGWGIDFPARILESFYQKTFVQNQILGRVLMESFTMEEGRFVIGHIDRKTMAFYGAKPSDLDGIVNHLRNTKGCDCAIFLHEIGELQYKISLRTSTAIDAAGLAERFGGGGHARAAGCTMNGTFHDCVNNLLRFVGGEARL